MQKSNEMAFKVSVIGGSGFIGTHFCQALHELKISFEIIDLNASARFPNVSKIADVRDIASLRQTVTGQVIVNLAAIHRDDVKNTNDYHETNVNGAHNIKTICDEKNIKKLIFVSTVAVYGFAEPGTGENGKIKPFNEYGRTKFEAEQKLRDWQHNSDNHLIIIRPTVVFGEGNRGNVYNLLNQIASKRFLMIGSGKNKKSMAYIGNVVSFLVACISSNIQYAVYNYVDSPDMDMNSLVKQVKQTLKLNDGIDLRLPYWLGLSIGYIADVASVIFQRKIPLSSIRVRKFCAPTEFTSQKHLLDGFRAPFTLVEGLERTIQSEFIEPNPDREIFYTE